MPITILEIGDRHAAGYAGKLFKRWGADVIRVDDTAAHRGRTSEDTAIDLYLHAGKKRAALDWSTAAGRDLLHRLAARSDILLTDLDVTALERLDWQSLGEPTLGIRAAITPFGMNGPYRSWADTGSVLLAMGGQTIIMGDPGRAPLTLPGRYLYYQAGQFAYATALAILRNRPAQAQTIDVSVFETALALSQFTTVMWTFGERIRERHGNAFSTLHPITMYPCADGWFAVNVVADFWDPFTIMLDRPDLLHDERFATNPARVEHRLELDEIILAQLGGKSRAEILELGQRVYRVPTGILSTLEELLNDPHLAARNFWQTLRHDGRDLKVPGSPWRYVGSDQPEQAQPVGPVDPQTLDHAP